MNCKFKKFPLSCLDAIHKLFLLYLSKNHYIISSSFFILPTDVIFQKFNIFKGFDILHNINIIIALTNLTFKEPLGRSRMNIESMKAKKRVVKLITIVILIFTICWLPLQVKVILQWLRDFSRALIYTTFSFSRNTKWNNGVFSSIRRNISLFHFITH